MPANLKARTVVSPGCAYPWSVSILVFLLDQVSKWLASHYLVLYDPKPVLPFLNLVLAHNTGAAFSFLSSDGGWQFIFLVTLGLLACVMIAIWLYRLPSSTVSGLSLGLASVLGGALGNLLDRLWHGHVIDFIDLFYKNWHWPVFNIADTAISLGAIAILMALLRSSE